MIAIHSNVYLLTVIKDISIKLGYNIPWHLGTRLRREVRLPMMDLLFKTIIGPIVVSIILRLVDKWLNRDRYC